MVVSEWWSWGTTDIACRRPGAMVPQVAGAALERW